MPEFWYRYRSWYVRILVYNFSIFYSKKSLEMTFKVLKNDLHTHNHSYIQIVL